MLKRILWLVCAATALPLRADTLYKCVQDGRTTYTNQKGGKNCEIVAQDKPVSTFSAPPNARQAPRQSSPGDFPRVNGEQQKARDSDRRAILEQELANEQKLLDEAKKVLAEQEAIILPEERGVGGAVYADKREARLRPHRDKVQLHERNLESIRREIGNLK